METKKYDYKELPVKFQTAFKDSYKEGRGIVLMGQAGTGKTTCMKTVKEMLYDSLSVNVTDLLEDIKAEFNERGTRIINDCIKYQYMILDDLGMEQQTEWSDRVLYQIINGRYAEGKTIYVTTNLTPEEIEKKYGDQIYSRLRVMTNFVILEEDLRKAEYGKII